MLKPVSEITVIVIDSGGNYISLAQRLARDCKKVYYCCNWQTGFPKYNSYCVGLNVPDIERVDHWAEVVDECDLLCFPDLYMGALQDWFVSKGKPVFGARLGENMEIYRDEFKELLESLNLPVNKYEVIKGFDALKTYLEANEDKWVKTSIIRGNGETFHWNNKRLSESRLDELQHTLGAFKDEAVFVVETPILDAVEIGFDGFSISGLYPDIAMTGIEIKDAGYVGIIMEYKKLPKVLQEINKQFSAFFAGTGYKCFFSNEVRWTGKEGYFIDATCRIPQPPGDLQMELYENFSEAVWQMAHGVVPELKPLGKFGAQIIIKSDWATNDPQAVYFPKKYANRVKLKNLMYKDGLPYFIPGEVEMSEIGSVIGIGNTMDEAIADARKIAATVEGDCITINAEALDKAAGEIEKLKSFNINLI